MPPLLLAFLLSASAPPDHATAPVPSRPAPLRLPAVAGRPGLPLIVLDPGHGGHDPGTAAHGRREKDAALALARAARAALLAGGQARVALTRDDDRYLPLAERREAARALDAALFLSIHLDSSADPAVHGASLYTLAERASDTAAHGVAARENRADAGGPAADGALPGVLLALAQRGAQADARRFARLLGRALAPTGLLKADWERAAALKVLRAPDVPSVLLEAGYLSNPADRRRLAGPGRAALARGIARAVAAYLGPVGDGASGGVHRTPSSARRLGR